MMKKKLRRRGRKSYHGDEERVTKVMKKSYQGDEERVTMEVKKELRRRRRKSY